MFGNKFYELSNSNWFSRLKFGLLSFCRAKKNQYVYTTWHGTPIKKICGDEPGKHVYDVDCRNIYMIVDNDFLRDVMTRISFGKMKFKLLGSPRNDILDVTDNKYIYDLKKKLNLDPNKKIIFFAPTFRTDAGTLDSNIKRSGVNQIESIDFDKLFETLKNKFGGEWVFVCRFHYHVDNSVNWEELKRVGKGRIINGNENDDISQYLLCTDILISDVSSCMYDFSKTRKPIFCFFPDKEYYENEERGLYVSMQDTPFGCAKTFDELIDAINFFDFSKYNKEIDLMRQRMGFIENKDSAELISKQILQERNLL